MNQPFIMGVLDCIQQLQIDSSDITEFRQRTAQIAGERPSINEGHHQIQNALFIAKLDQWQNVGMMQPRHNTRLSREAAPHFGIISVVPKNDLDRHASTKRSTLSPLIDSPHASHTNAPDDIIVSKLPAFQSEH